MAAATRNWRTFLQSLRSGDDRETALDFAGMSLSSFESTLRGGGSHALEYEDAATEGLRARWGVAEAEGIIDALVRGEQEGSLERIVEERGLSYPEFLRLIERDPFISQKYAEGRRMQAESMADEIVRIAGDKESKTKVDTLKWLMAKMSERYDQARKDASRATDSAELDMLLEEGRRRVEALHAQRKEEEEDAEPGPGVV